MTEFLIDTLWSLGLGMIVMGVLVVASIPLMALYLKIQEVCRGR